MKKNPKNNQIYLRGHHLLCLQGYQGYGYDKKFKKNMDNIFHQLNINNISNIHNIDADSLNNEKNTNNEKNAKNNKGKNAKNKNAIDKNAENNKDKNDKNEENNNDNENKKKNILKPKIILTDYPDDLCLYCPKLRENKCTGELENLEQTEKNIKKIKTNDEKIIEMDQTVLKEAKLKKNTKYSIKEAILAVNKVFSTLENAKKVCGKCEWENECLWFKSREH